MNALPPADLWVIGQLQAGQAVIERRAPGWPVALWQCRIRHTGERHYLRADLWPHLGETFGVVEPLT